MKKTLLNTVIVLLSLSLAGCMRESTLQEINDVYIDLSDEIVNLSNGEDDALIEVRTNSLSWVAEVESLSQDWITLIKNENSLIISVTSNTLSQIREGKVVITAEDVSKDIIIRQSQALSAVTLSDDNISIPQKGGETIIKVQSEGKEWSIEGDDLYDWFAVLKGENSIYVKAMENASTEKRIGKFYLNTPASIIEVTLTQSGKDAYILPYLPSKLISKAEVLQDTRDKGMFYLQTIPNPQNTGLLYEFEANDGRDSKAGYEFIKGKEMYTRFRLVTANNQYGETEDFHKFLLSKGFELVDNNIINGMIYKVYHYTTYYYSTILTIKVNPTQKSTELTFDMSEVQSGDMPTFKQVPYRNTALFNTADFFEVKEWEESKGGTLEVMAARTRGTKNPNIIVSAQFYSLTQEESHFVTLYFFEETKAPYVSKLNQRIDIYTDPSLGLWENSDGRIGITREFDALLKSEGFEYQYRVNSGGREWITYFAPQQTLVLMITRVEQLDGANHMAINFYRPLPSEDGSEQEALMRANQMLKTYR